MTTDQFDATTSSVTACRRHLADTVQARLVERGWRQVDLADAAGVRKDVISLVVRGLRLPGRETLQAIAGAFDADEETLIPGIGRRRVVGGAAAEPSGPSERAIRLTSTGDGRMRVQLDTAMPLDRALEIARLVEGGDATAAEEPTQ